MDDKRKNLVPSDNELEEVNPLPVNAFVCNSPGCKRGWLAIPVSESAVMFVSRLREGEEEYADGDFHEGELFQIGRAVFRVVPLFLLLGAPECPVCGKVLTIALRAPEVS